MPTFPSLRPSFVESFQPANYKVLTRQFNSGEHRIRTQYLGQGSQLILKYNFLTSAEAEQLIDFWHSVRGSLMAFDLPDAIIQHPDTVKAGLNVALGVAMKWRFIDGAGIETIAAGGEGGIYSATLTIQSAIA